MEIEERLNVATGCTFVFGIMVLVGLVSTLGVGQEQVDVQVTVLSKDVVASSSGALIYSVMFDTPEGAFAYSASSNSMDVYNSVSVEGTYTITYCNYPLNNKGVKYNKIIKINGVSVE